MSRLDDVLGAHDRKLREELAAAQRRMQALLDDTEKQKKLIDQLESDLTEVTDELDKRGINQNKKQGTTIREEPDRYDLGII